MLGETTGESSTATPTGFFERNFLMESSKGNPGEIFSGNSWWIPKGSPKGTHYEKEFLAREFLAESREGIPGGVSKEIPGRIFRGDVRWNLQRRNL